MATNGESASPVLPKEHRTDGIAQKFVEKSGKAQDKADKAKDKVPGGNHEHQGPAGGFDKTPIPYAPPGYTLRFTFHKAKDLPMADYTSLSSDPYMVATLKTALPKRHKQDPDLTFRTPTIRRNVDPEWEQSWIVANVPASGFRLKARLYDEDPADHDDRLGNITINVPTIGNEWQGIHHKEYSIKKRMGSKRAYLIRGIAVLMKKDKHMSGNVTVSIEMLGRTEGESGGRMYTAGPCNWSQHFSPLIGRLTGTKDPSHPASPGDGKNGKQPKSYDFQSNQIQLAGPVPEQLYHRYVEFKPFVAGMFTSHSLRGRILNRALHHQHSRIYNYDRSTTYGSLPFPSKDLTKQFLDLVHYDQGGRIYTYVLTLDGQWRFTETGKEFGIDLLSKHTMHSDVAIYIAWSGEFFIRRLKNAWKDPEDQDTHPPVDMSGGPPEDDPPKDPSYYQLVIDNDSGTYRPNAELLPLLKEFMHKNLPGLKITTLDCRKDEEKMGKMKTEQRERKKAEGKGQVYVQGNSSDSSLSSSDEEDLQAADGQGKQRNKLQQIGHDAKEPKGKIMAWAEGETDKQQREKREGGDDDNDVEALHSHQHHDHHHDNVGQGIEHPADAHELDSNPVQQEVFEKSADGDAER
ncbi:hypothetical protein MMC25_007091 [Agyrium rufum]|nr:hypothetical protein [Agyrium rufum]